MNARAGCTSFVDLGKELGQVEMHIRHIAAVSSVNDLDASAHANAMLSCLRRAVRAAEAIEFVSRSWHLDSGVAKQR